MRNITVRNKLEEDVALRAVKKLRASLEEKERIKKFLESKKFHLGDVVTKKGTSYFGGVFGVGEGNIGCIVGWDFEHGYYRVYYREENPFIGVKEEKLESYKGEVHLEVGVSAWTYTAFGRE